MANGETIVEHRLDAEGADPLTLTGVTDRNLQEIPRLFGIRVVMLTGDNRTSAEAVARKLHIDEVEAEVLPEDKGKIVQRLKDEGRVVVMAGDGVNDAPALAQADLGMALSSGSAVAMETALVISSAVKMTLA